MKLCGLEVVWMAVFLCHSLTLDLREVKNSVFKSLGPWISVHLSKLSVSRGSPVLLNRDISTHTHVYITVIFQYKNSIITSNFNDTVSLDSLQGGMMGTLSNLEPHPGFKSHSSLSLDSFVSIFGHTSLIGCYISFWLFVFDYLSGVLWTRWWNNTLLVINKAFTLAFFKVKKLLHHIFAGIFTNHRHYDLTVNTQLLQQFYLPL